MRLVGVSSSTEPFAPFSLEKALEENRSEMEREISQGLQPGSSGAFFLVRGATMGETVALINRVTRHNLTDRDFFRMTVRRGGITYLERGESLRSFEPLGVLDKCLDFGHKGKKSEALLDCLVNMSKAEPPAEVREFVQGLTCTEEDTLVLVLARKRAAMPKKSSSLMMMA